MTRLEKLIAAHDEFKEENVRLRARITELEAEGARLRDIVNQLTEVNDRIKEEANALRILVNLRATEPS